MSTHKCINSCCHKYVVEAMAVYYVTKEQDCANFSYCWKIDRIMHAN